MKHRWEVIPRSKPTQSVCVQCGYIRTTEVVIAMPRRTVVRSLTKYQRKLTQQLRLAPDCDNIWPEDWKVPNRLYAMYLDDVRDPPRITDVAWVVVRSFDEAVQYVEKHGFPSYISFDHDLGDNVPTGKDFALWIVNRHLDKIDNFPRRFSYEVHSANPPGAANIRGLMENFLKFVEIEKEQEILVKMSCKKS